MIGPHEGKELELMLAGKKHLAIFCESVIPGYDIPEAVIPEKKFSSHISNGTFLRFEKEFTTKIGIIRYVCFTTQGEAWRANAYFWMNHEGFSGKRPFDDAYEYFIGRLLGYGESDIAHFLTHRTNSRRTGS